jgi:membrane protease YdiL (CAAX protease family)
MADRVLIYNCAWLSLMAGSIGIWILIVVRQALGRPVMEPVEPHCVSWPVAPPIVTFLVAILAPQLLTAVAFSWFGAPERVSLTTVQWLCACQVLQIATVVGLLAVAGPLQGEDFGCRRKSWRIDMLIGAGGWVASFAPIYLVRKWQASLDWHEPDSEHLLFQVLAQNFNVYGLFWIYVSATVLAPLSEELMYRVLLQGWAQSRLPAGLAILISACLFVSRHTVFDWLPLLPLALILGYIYHCRRSFLAIVTMHALFNGSMLTLAILSK